MVSYNSIIILGATATGKTKLAVQLAANLNGEIISADSRQVFRGMDIGTGKDLCKYHVENKIVKHYLIDILDAGQKYNVNAFKKDVSEAFLVIKSKEKTPIICGGTGMYIHSLLTDQPFTAVPANPHLREKLSGLNKEELIQRLLAMEDKRLLNTDMSSSKRIIRGVEIGEFLKYNDIPTIYMPDIKPLIIGLKSDISQTRAAIKKRLDQRLDNGLIEEVEGLLFNGISHDMLRFYGLEYRLVSQYLLGECTLEELKTNLYTAICQYAKRQNTFFRKMEKDGTDINWLNSALPTIELYRIIADKLYLRKE